MSVEVSVLVSVSLDVAVSVDESVAVFVSVEVPVADDVSVAELVSVPVSVVESVPVPVAESQLHNPHFSPLAVHVRVPCACESAQVQVSSSSGVQTWVDLSSSFLEDVQDITNVAAASISSSRCVLDIITFILNLLNNIKALNKTNGIKKKNFSQLKFEYLRNKKELLLNCFIMIILQI